MSDYDECLEVEWPELTLEDLARIDSLCQEYELDDAKAGTIGASVNSYSSSLPTDQDLKDKNGSKNPEIRSPFSQFKSYNYLSVSDIVAPAWCEVQFDYGLRQFRNRPVERRPPTFVTDKGKEITVKKSIALSNDKIQKKGQAVHRALEKDVHKEEVVLKVTRVEEVWASRFVDFLSRLKVLVEEGLCREVPVWGIVQDQPVFGFIDELRCNVKQRPYAIDPSQTKLESFIKRPVRGAAYHAMINVIDSKTRSQATLPSDSDAYPSRLQLMMYRRLLSQALLPPNEDTTFVAFCARLGLNIHEGFSNEFHEEMAALVVQNELSFHFLDAKCLSDMGPPFYDTLSNLGLDRPGIVTPSLTLEYRLRDRRMTWRKRGRSQAPDSEVSITPGAEVITPIEEGTVALGSPTIATAIALVDASDRVSDIASVTTSAFSDINPVDVDDMLPPRVIGRKVFKYNAVLLEAHVANTLDWWYGKRPPRGVDIEDSNRCRSCEYKDGCEWREQKALEIARR